MNKFPENISLLAIDTSTDLCSVAILHKANTYVRSIIQSKIHAKKVLPLVDSLLKEVGVSIKEMDALIVTQGPGSFTGIRIGMSIMQSFAFVYNKPLILVSTLQFYAQSIANRTNFSEICVALDAKMGEIYWGQYVNKGGIMESIIEDQAIRPTLLQINCQQKMILGVGNGFALYKEILQGLVTKVEDDFSPKLIDIFLIAIRELKEQKYSTADRQIIQYCQSPVSWSSN